MNNAAVAAAALAWILWCVCNDLFWKVVLDLGLVYSRSIDCCCLLLLPLRVLCACGNATDCCVLFTLSSHAFLDKRLGVTAERMRFS